MPPKTKATAKKTKKAPDKKPAKKGSPPKKSAQKASQPVKPAARLKKTATSNNSKSSQFATLDEAKSAAIDVLLQVIEEAEDRLVAMKQAASFEELAALGDYGSRKS
ncbi:MAG: hypothetical protein DWQ37_00710 [Planctomycetota bacterium]|nr:MAG: hypothetical protein DWQ37_00710 [Planctomycetota bacterium]